MIGRRALLASAIPALASCAYRPDPPMRDDFTDHILAALIDPALAAIEPYLHGDTHDRARALLFAVGMAESGYRVDHQVGGPALGYWQMEVPTANSVWSWAWHEHHDLFEKLGSLREGQSEMPHALEFNPHFSCALARVFFLRVREPIPDISLRAFADYWKHYYNTYEGKGTVEGFIQRVSPAWPSDWPQ